MKKLLTFLTLLTLSIGVSWAAETVTINATSGNGGFFRWSSAKNTGSSDPAIVSDYLRLYAGNTLSFYIANNNPKKFKSIKFTDTGQKTHNWASLTANNGTFNSDTKTWTAADETTTSVTFTNTNSGGGNLQIKVVEVTYVGDGGDTPEPTTYALTLPTGLTGGTVTATGYSDLTAIPAGTNMTVTATPATGYTLEWMKANGVEVQSPYEFAINAATAITASFTEQSTPQPSGSNKFERINNVNKLEVGARYLLVYETKPAVMGGIEGSGNTIHGASIESGFTIANGVLTLNANSDAKPLTLGEDNGNWTFKLDDNYLTWTSGNSLNTASTISNNTKWAIEIATSGEATITNVADETRYLRYNYSSPRFACYTPSNDGSLTGRNCYLYKEITEVVEAGDLYIVGQVNGDGSEPMSTTNGVKLTYNQTSDTYSGDFYCIGVSNTSGYSNFLFSKKLPFSFSNTSDLYGAGADGSYWPISENGQNESHFGDAIPLFAKSTDNFRIPAGLYTVTVKLSGATGENPKFEWTDKSIVVTKRDVTMAINSTGSNYFDDTKEVTMTSNLTELGGKIYYTTNGGNPSDPNSGRIEYTAPITIDATTTFKAVAYVGNLYSPIAEKTFTKTPKAPVITPNGGHIHEATQVTITCETEGASIYYTLDGSTPTKESTLYTGAFTVSTTTTVKARAYVGDTYSNSIATAEFVYSEPIIPGTGDFQLVTSASQLVAGNELIIVTTYEDLDDDLETVTYNYAMGAINSSNKGSHTTDFTFQGVIGTANSAITAGSGVNILKLGGSDGAFTLQQESDEKFLSMTKSNTNISASYSGSPLLITVDDSDYRAYVGNNAADNDRQILYSIENNNNVFGNYKSSNIGNNYKEIYLYYREAPATPKTLAEIVALGAAADGKKFTISDANGLLGVYKSGNTVWFKDENGYATPDVCNSSDNNYEIDLGDGDKWYSKDATFDQSNWIEVVFRSEANYDGNYVKNLTGTYSYNGGNPKLTITKAVKDPEDVAVASPAYTPNRYCIANFGGSQEGFYMKNGSQVECTYFFVTPKPQEYAEIILAVYNNGTLSMPAKANTDNGISGTINVDLSKNGSYEPVDETLYTGFNVIVSKVVRSSMLKAYGDYKVSPVNLTAADIPTAISTVAVNGEVKSVKYVNVAGMVSDRPFEGVNIVVTEYTDGSRTTAKMVR